MNRMTWPSLSLISLRTALSRSSNSPRNLAPAMSAPRSSEITRLSLSPSGTSPRTIRWARPSTIAVLPTPGSPIRTGLFFVRRERTWMTRRTSSSRPMTGSSLPGAGLGRQVAAVLLERLIGALGVRRRHPLAAAHALERAEDRLATGTVTLEQRLALAADLGRAEEKVLGRDVLVAEPASLLLGPFDDALRAWVEAERPALDPGSPGEDRRRARHGTPAGRRRAAGGSRRGRRRPARRAPTGGARHRGSGCGGPRPASVRRGSSPGPSG